MSELAEREMKETSVIWRDCCTQLCLPVAASNAAVGLEQALCGVSCPVNQWQHAERGQQYAYGGLSQGG